MAITRSTTTNKIDGFPFTFTTCASCGKQFIKAACSIYNIRTNGKTKHYCSYTCYQKAKNSKKEINNEANHKQFGDECKG